MGRRVVQNYCGCPVGGSSYSLEKILKRQSRKSAGASLKTAPLPTPSDYVPGVQCGMNEAGA